MHVYKYLAPERVDVLRRGLIRYTQPGALNDPFEARPYVASLATPEKAKNIFNEILPDEVRKAFSELPPAVRAMLPPETLEKLTRQRVHAEGGFPAILDSFRPAVASTLASKMDELIGILSLTEKPDNLLMWSHYSKSHEGFVIGFDSAHPYFDERKGPKDEFRHLRKVDYRQDRPAAPLSEFDGVDVFLVKSTHWQYEEEWRIVRALPDSDEVIAAAPFAIHLFRFPDDAVSEVIIGSRMPDDRRSDLKGTLSDARFDHVKVHLAVPDDQRFEVRLVDLPRRGLSGFPVGSRE